MMTFALPPTLAQLWALTGVTPGTPESAWNAVFDPVGLILHFPLEGLVYAREETLDELRCQRFLPHSDDEHNAVLKMISAEFSLIPWFDPEGRLHELENQFGRTLELLPIEK